VSGDAPFSECALAALAPPLDLEGIWSPIRPTSGSWLIAPRRTDRSVISRPSTP
jgi:hypothetical protein